MTVVSEQEQQEGCSLCGRVLFVGEFVWSGRQQAFVCPDCLAEEESCGCEDEW